MLYLNTKELKIKRLLELYAKEVYRVALHTTKDEEKAKEVFTEVFVQVYLSMDKLEEERGWDLNSQEKSDRVRSYLIVYASMIAKRKVE